jgi:Calcineurin-like phosphoesterase
VSRRASAPPAPPFEPGEAPPKKVAWLSPIQLIRTAYHVWLSTVAVEYLDRRETLAALDGHRFDHDNPLVDPVIKPGKVVDAFVPKLPEGGVRIDFVADIGDSWEATYATAKMLVTDELKVRGLDTRLKPAHVVLLGGDLVYPTPSRERYRRRTRSALIAARPAHTGNDPGLFAIPGNHDWYDGLTNFVREFCQRQYVGGWSMFQRRSYFAVKVAPGWWIWGIDIALDTRIDVPQQSFFLRLLSTEDVRDEDEQFHDNDNIILCTPKPCWTDDDVDSDAYRNLTYFVREIVERKEKNKRHGFVRVILAGDVHHYSRYGNRRGDQLITAGGGGSYLMATHQLPRTLATLLPPADEPRRELAGEAPEPVDERKADAYLASDFPYPDRPTSRRLALRALFLAFRPANWPFVLFVGAVQCFLAWTLRQTLAEGDFQGSARHLFLLPLQIALGPSATPVFFTILSTLIVCGILPIASQPSARKWLTGPWGVLHGTLQCVLALLLIRFVDTVVLTHKSQLAAALKPLNETAAVLLTFVVFIVVIGGLAGASLVGIYFVVSDLLFGWHTNEVFAAQSIVDYRNFLRMKIAENGDLTIYPIGLRKVPLKWRLRLDRKKTEPWQPFYDPADEVLAPHLIEGPIIVPRRIEV